MQSCLLHPSLIIVNSYNHLSTYANVIKSRIATVQRQNNFKPFDFQIPKCHLISALVVNVAFIDSRRIRTHRMGMP